MSESLILMEALENIVNQTCDCLQCDRTSVFIYDE